MNGYVEGGYIVALSVLSTYAASVIAREKRVQRRIAKESPSPALPEVVKERSVTGDR